MKWGFKIILFFALMAILAPVISNDKPLLVISNNQISFPFLTEENKLIGENDFYIMPLVPYRAGASDFNNTDFKKSIDFKKYSFVLKQWVGYTFRCFGGFT